MHESIKYDKSNMYAEKHTFRIENTFERWQKEMYKRIKKGSK
jgi:hypothetical protein